MTCITESASSKTIVFEFRSSYERLKSLAEAPVINNLGFAEDVTPPTECLETVRQYFDTEMVKSSISEQRFKGVIRPSLSGVGVKYRGV